VIPARKAVPSVQTPPHAKPVRLATLSNRMAHVSLTVRIKTVVPVLSLKAVILATRDITTVLVIVMSVLIPCPAVLTA
jgi:hypothetical protein